MAEVITVTFQDGAFIPDQPVHVAAGTRAKVVLDETVTGDGGTARTSEEQDAEKQLRPIDAFLKFS
jgi:predicted DNA-binding antitoxin AbrB/MazE fold protein